MLAQSAPRPRESRWFPSFLLENAARKLLLDEQILTYMPRLCLRTIFRLFYKQTRWKVGRFFQRRRYEKELGPPRIFRFTRGRDGGRRFTTDSAQPRRAKPEIDSSPGSQRSTVANSKRSAWAAKLRQVKLVALRSLTGIGFKVFAALELHSDHDGYCWPLVETIQKLIGIDRRRSIFQGLAELDEHGLIDRRKLISRGRGRNAPTLYRIGGKIENLPPNAAKHYVLGPDEPKKSMSERVKRGRGVEKRHVGGEVSKNDSTEVSKNATRRGVEKRHPELGVNQELDSGAAHHAPSSSSSFSPNIQPDDDDGASAGPSEQNPATQTGNSITPVEERTKLSPAQRAWMQTRILDRAGQVVRSEHNYIRAAEPAFVANWDGEVFEWAVESAEIFLQREVLDRQDRGEEISTQRNHAVEHIKNEAAKNGLIVTKDEVNSAIQGASVIKGITWSIEASNDTNKRKVEPNEAAELQKQIEVLMREIDETDRARQTPGCSNPDLLIEKRKLLVRQLVKLQHKLREQ
jgi:hypothetical protein